MEKAKQIVRSYSSPDGDNRFISSKGDWDWLFGEPIPNSDVKMIDSKAQGIMQDLLDNGVGIEEAIVVGIYLNRLTLAMGMNVGDYKTNITDHSAYDALFNGIRNSSSFSQAINAVFDAAGYNTAIIGASTQATPCIKIGEYWFSIVEGEFKLIGDSLAISDSEYMYAAQTYE